MQRAHTSRSRRASRNLFILSFISPAILLYAVFVVWPLLQSFQISLYRWHGLSKYKQFVGVQNYKKLAQDDAFKRSLEHNLALLLIILVGALVIGVLLAHAMQGTGKMAKLLRSIYLFPQVMSLVVVAILWQFIFDPNWGLVTSGLKAVGLSKLPAWLHSPRNEIPAWLGDPHTAFGCVAIAFLWYVAGFYIMLFSAGLRGISAEVQEAAELDGALGWRRFWKVTWPMLWSIKRVAVVYVVINVMNAFALIKIMTDGGPDRSTEVMLTYLYEQAFKNSQYGYATALALVNFVVAMLLSVIILFIYRKSPEAARA
ncbi:MAG TPA: sugar ABC transporter permease [Fimbriimonadaceae bacterium]|jgi:N-acetylglucosamine transport system permease protein